MAHSGLIYIQKINYTDKYWNKKNKKKNTSNIYITIINFIPGNKTCRKTCTNLTTSKAHQ